MGAKDRLLLIHGINSGGEWYRVVEPLLRPHFDCYGVRYAHYEQLGAVKVFLLPLTSRIYPSLRVVRAQVERYAPTGTIPHLIAHSFGTYLTGELLKRYPHIEFGEVILHGSILPRQFNWRKLLRPHRRVAHVWNEVGLRDLVVRAVKLGQHLRLTLGRSGLEGFAEVPGIVDTLPGPHHVCTCGFPANREPSDVALVHNVRLEYDHEDAHILAGHAAAFWVPILLRLSPLEYRDFLKLCEMWVTLVESGLHFEASKIEKGLLRRRWAWAGGTLLDYLREEAAARLDGKQTQATADSIARAATENLARIVADANRRTADGITFSDEDAARATNPRIACSRAINGVFLQLGLSV